MIEGNVSAVQARQAQQGERARRMRITATLLLAVMAVLFLVARSYRDVHSAWGYVAAFAEAAMVGGLADWFAITALFRHPLGLPIPHTAIIPKNKDRIADTMADFLRNNFLTPGVVARRMREMNLAQALGTFLQQPHGKASGRISSGAGGLLAELLESLDPQRLGQQVKAGLVRQAERLEVAPLLGNVLTVIIADGRHRPLVDALIRWIGNALENNEALVRTMIHDRAHSLLRWTGLDERLANSALDGLYRTLAEILVDPNHPVRLKIDQGLEKLAYDLLHDPEMRQKVEAMKRDMLADPAIGEWWMGVWENLRQSLIIAARNPSGNLSEEFSESLVELGRALNNDIELQIQVNRFVRRTAVGVVTRYGAQIVRLVSETVRRWDARVLTGRVEGAVGRDLQFIRINGTVVGGLVGIAIHSVEKLL